MVRILGTVASVMLMGFLLAPAVASLYQPDEPMAVPVKLDGLGEPLPFDEFQRRSATLANQMNPDFKSPDGKPTDRDKLLARTKELQRQSNRSPDDTAALAADLLRLGQTDIAVNLLKPLYDDRERKGTRTYAVCAALIHAHALRGEWDLALNYVSDLYDVSPPAKVRGWTDAQRDWFIKLDRIMMPHYLMIRKDEARIKSTPETEGPTPLFPIPVPAKSFAPVRFVNDAGQYDPAGMAKVQRDKLPPDALAITQQLLLWFPTDTQLYWLLAELYASAGQFAESRLIFDQCAWSRQYGNRKQLMEHRAVVARLAGERSAAAAIDERRLADEQAAAEERRKAEERAAAEKEAENNLPISLRAIVIYFGAVVLIGGFALMRSLSRRGKGSGGLNCCG